MRVGDHLRPLTFLVGAFGSGKTEIAINLALLAAREGLPVTLIDLDTVTPALRSRQAAGILAAAGVELVAPAGQLAHADLPAVPAGVRAALEDGSRYAIIDVGGSPAGARVLASLADPIASRERNCWAVVSPWRPGTSDAVSACRELRAIELLAKLRVTGLVGNLHLPAMDVPADQVRRGLAVVQATARAMEIPVAFLTVGPGRLAQVSSAVAAGGAGQAIDIMELSLHMKAPWEDDSGAIPWFVAPGPAACAVRRYE